MFKVVLKRFLKGAVSGALGSAVVVASVVPSATFTDISNWLALLASSLIIGAVSGGLLAAEKAVNYKK